MKRIFYCCLLLIELSLFNFVKAQDIQQLVKQRPFTINGTLGAGMDLYTSNGINQRQRKFSYLFNGAPVISLYGIAFPFSVVISDQQKGFRQPFNQYGISPTYKWATLHAGWQSIQWSEFTLAGYNFLGGGIELNPGKLRFGFIYGRFNKAIEENQADALTFQTPSYKRVGYSARLGVGTERNHFDVTFLNAKDKISSIQLPSTLSELHPSENMVMGINSKFMFLKHLAWNLDVAGSLYTRNRLDDTIANEQLDKVAFLKKLITINTSTQLLTAAQTSLNYQHKAFNIGIQYRRVDPDYKSMGAYYFETDVVNYTVQGGANFIKNQLQLTGSLGLQNDNILHDKSYTSNRKIGSLSINFNKAKYGINLRYSNYGVTQDRGLNPIVDTLRVARTNYNVNALLRYSIGDTLISHNFILVGSLQSLVDLNQFTANQNETNSKTGNLSYQIGFHKSALSINTNFNYTVADISTMQTFIYGPSVGVSKQLDKGKLSLNTSVAYQLQRNNNISAGSVINASLNGGYRLSKKDGLNISVALLKSNSKDISLPSFNEMRSSFNLIHTF